MLPRITAPVAVPSLIVGALLSLSACSSESHAYAASTPAAIAEDHAEISAEVAATAKVVAIDKSDRSVTLRGEDGRMVDVMVGEAARNFDQIKVGDDLKVRYKQTLSATRLPRGEDYDDDDDAQAGMLAARAAKGQKPAGVVGAMASVNVRIVSIDTAREIVVFSLPSGELIARQVETAEGRRFVKGLRVGDRVRLDFAVALALSVEEARASG